MAYRNGTYVAFDGQGTTDPTQSDLHYYALLRSWDKNEKFDFKFSDSHQKTYAVSDSSKRITLENRLMERMRNSKNMLVILSKKTNFERGLLNFEIEKAVDLYKLPLIVAYTNTEDVFTYDAFSNRWPKALVERINNKSANAVHIPFKEEYIIEALNRYSVHNTSLVGPYNTLKI